MFGLGYQELLIILVIVLILFGAQRLPDLAKSLGSSVKEFKKGVNELQGRRAHATASRRRRSRRKKRRRPSSRISGRRHARASRPFLVSADSFHTLTSASRPGSRRSPSRPAWPYRARMLYNWDAVQFALALREFDVAKHQPHPPGYLLYVGLGRLVNQWVGDPAQAYVGLAMLFSAATTFIVYWLARKLYDRPTASRRRRSSRSARSSGSTGRSASPTPARRSARRWSPGRRGARSPGASATRISEPSRLGLVGGIRQSVLVLMFPLWLGCAVARPALLVAPRRGGGPRHRRRARVAPAADLAQRGPRGLHRVSTQLYGSIVLPTSVFGGSLVPRSRRSRYLAESIIVGLGPLAIAFLALPTYARRAGWNRAEWFLLAWIVPPAAFYALVHFGQAGYVLTFLPALVILLARALVEAVAAGSERLRRPNWRWALTAVAVIAFVLINTGLLRARPPGAARVRHRAGDAWLWRARDEVHDWIMSRTAAALEEHEAVIRTYVDTIRAAYDPEDTALLTELGNPRSYPWLRHAMYYMPEYAIYQVQLGDVPGYYAPQSAATMILTPGYDIQLPRQVKQIVWFVDHWDPTIPRPAGLLEIPLPYGRFLYLLPLDRAVAEHAGYTFARGQR